MSDYNVLVTGGSGFIGTNLVNFIDINGLKKFIKIEGNLPYESLPKQYNEFKLLVILSSTEGLPNVMLEAMACGTPVLAAPVGSIPDIIINDETGFLSTDRTPEGISNAVVKLLYHSYLN